MPTSAEILSLNKKYGARNYLPLPVVLAHGEGIWVTDPEGKRYMDMLSAYSAMNFGHRHPRIIQALKDQADRITLTSRAFNNDQLGDFCQVLSKLTGRKMVLPMNTGAEAVETAIKTVRRWAYQVKGVAEDKAEIICCAGNFHGRTITIVSFSTEDAYRSGFGPFTPGFKVIEYGSMKALEEAINPNTAAFLVEPIQGEGGIIIPPKGYLKEAYQLCKDNNVLFVADEIQTGFGRAGKMFACDWEDVHPDLYILGKALGGGVLPISVVTADEEVLGVFEPGSHGSTFGGNPLACAVAIVAMDVLEKEDLVAKSAQKGQHFTDELKKINNPKIKEVRGKGLLVGVELTEKARPYCEKLMELGILAKETHDNVIRFAPPLIISDQDLDWALDKIRKVFQ
ncbi:MAG: ornithine--oxo-acid transaminase [Firmicutes bacterium]|nr:ornithine--oxo-acid transaminase [Bacillota bacterium]